MVLLVIGSAGACSNPFVFTESDPDDVYLEFNSNVLTEGVPHVETRRALRRYGLEETFAGEPVLALEMLHDAALRHGDPDALFALAELCFLAATDEASAERDLFLSSAVYAWYYLFGPDAARRPHPFGARLRLACDYLNRGLSRALYDEETGGVQVAAGRRRLLIGWLEYGVEKGRFPWDKQFDHFLPADHYSVKGLSSRNWIAGIGAPLVATSSAAAAAPPAGADVIVPPNLSVPATLVLRLEGELAGLALSEVRGTLDLLPATETRTVDVAGVTVPLERDLTAPVAYMLGKSQAVELEITRFFGGAPQVDHGLILLAPYARGRIPVVLVHGTASSPARWAEMYNELFGDERIRERFQFWFFTYPSGQPILQSAAELRDALLAARRAFDPGQDDPAFARAVLVAHSQGGLLARLAVTDSGTTVWSAISDEPIDELDATAEEKALVRHLVEFEALPFVTRTVFVCTPHRGSELAAWLPARIASDFISLPKRLFGGLSDLLLRNPSVFKRVGQSNPTSIHAMTPGSLLVTTLEKLRIAERTRYHSIIAIDDSEDQPPEGADGVVGYWSAHLDGAESEFIVTSGHSCQANPLVIGEVRRILALQLAELEATAP